MPVSVAVAVHLDDVNVVSKPVQQSAGQPLRAEHLGPLVRLRIESRHKIIVAPEKRNF